MPARKTLHYSWTAVSLCLTGLIAAVAAVGASQARAATGQPTTLAEHGQATCIIVVPPGREVCRYAAGHLQNHIRQVCGEAPRLVESATLKDLPADKVIVALGVLDGFSDLAALGLGNAANQLKRDGYILQTASVDNHQFVLALAKTPTGTTNSAWHLMRELRLSTTS